VAASLASCLPMSSSMRCNRDGSGSNRQTKLFLLDSADTGLVSMDHLQSADSNLDPPLWLQRLSGSSSRTGAQNVFTCHPPAIHKPTSSHTLATYHSRRSPRSRRPSDQPRRSRLRELKAKGDEGLALLRANEQPLNASSSHRRRAHGKKGGFCARLYFIFLGIFFFVRKVQYVELLRGFMLR
jgi:hypothetical protein